MCLYLGQLSLVPHVGGGRIPVGVVRVVVCDIGSAIGPFLLVEAEHKCLYLDPLFVLPPVGEGRILVVVGRMVVCNSDSDIAGVVAAGWLVG